LPCYLGEIILNKYLLTGLGLCLCVAQAIAGEVKVSGAWARATAPGQDSAAVALHITSQKDANIIAVTSAAAGSVEIHSMTEENGMMQMRELDAFALKAKQEVALGDGGSHLMLVGLKKPLAVGDIVGLVITVQFADKHKERIEVNAEVRSLTESHNEHMHHH
jgi:copper(I)-binding protein